MGAPFVLRTNVHRFGGGGTAQPKEAQEALLRPALAHLGPLGRGRAFLLLLLGPWALLVLLLLMLP